MPANNAAFLNQQPQPTPLPVANPTHSFWIDSPGANPLASEGSDGPLTETADVCIIGSGITGVSAAYHLSVAVARGEIPSVSDKPLRVVILEARDFCSGATGRNGGHLTPLAIRALGMENHTAAEIVRLIHENGWTDAVDLVEGGHVTILLTAEEETDIKADYEAAKDAGVDVSRVRWFTKEQMQEKYGTSFPGVEIGGHNLWPLKFVTKLFLLAKNSVASPGRFELVLHTRTPVTSISPSPSPPGSDSAPQRWKLTTPRGSLIASHIIHATNAYASHLLPYLASEIVPTRGQIIATCAAVPASQLFTCSWDANTGFEYWFARPSESSPLVILGGGRTAQKPDFEFGQSDDSVLNPHVATALRRFLPAVYPGKFVEGQEPEMEWTGIMGFTKLRDPLVGPIPGKELPNQYISAGYSGHGMPRAFSCAAVVAGMVAAELRGQAFAVPSWFSEAYLTTWSCE
ncbi:FAD dependent oxidoreductase [Mycena amicta]|nr:FAD dependent oxidoreductase [Mycena amicta]